MPDARPLPAGLDEAALRLLVAQHSSWRSVLRSLGLTSPRHGRTLRDACHAWNIDLSHFGSYAWTHERLQEVVTRSTTWTEATRELGYARDSGSARATVRKHCGQRGISTSHLEQPTVLHSSCFEQPVDLSHLRRAGSFLVAARCALLGHQVSWPLEPCPYDLLVDTGPGGLQRVQVKTTTSRAGSTWAVSISRDTYAPGVLGGHRAAYSREEIDWFGIVDGDLEVYLIPVQAVEGLTTLHLARYAVYRLASTPVAAPAEESG